MLEFEQNADGSVIKEVSEATFMQDVVEASKERPVIVDFWAPWCGPCKTLGPQLEEAVKAANGAVTMAKVNVDENQMIAGQMQVQSIPTVFAFSNGQPVDGFQGAVSASEIKAFVERVVAKTAVRREMALTVQLHQLSKCLMKVILKPQRKLFRQYWKRTPIT